MLQGRPMKFFIPLLLLFSLVLIGCNKQQNVAELDDINELEQFFHEHQTEFNKLSSNACSFKKNTGLGFYHFTANAPVTYPEQLAHYAAQMEISLRQIRAEEIMLYQKSEGECSLFIKKWVIRQSTGGSHMGYGYQPAKLSEFNQVIHQKDNRDTKQRIFFTKALAEGWYIEYFNEP